MFCHENDGEENVMFLFAKKSGVQVPDAIGSGKRHCRHTAQKPVEEFLTPLDPSFRAALLHMYHGEPQSGADGQLHAIDPITRISPSQGMWLYDLCLATKPKATLEIGMAWAVDSPAGEVLEDRFGLFAFHAELSGGDGIEFGEHLHA